MHLPVVTSLLDRPLSRNFGTLACTPSSSTHTLKSKTRTCGCRTSIALFGTYMTQKNIKKNNVLQTNVIACHTYSLFQRSEIRPRYFPITLNRIISSKSFNFQKSVILFDQRTYRAVLASVPYQEPTIRNEGFFSGGVAKSLAIFSYCLFTVYKRMEIGDWRSDNAAMQFCKHFHRSIRNGSAIKIDVSHIQI